MATKVKGDAIKEGSIPLSALSNEVKDKIENVGDGADWNAQEGEPGYIENKPFGIEYCSWDSNDGEYSISGNKLIVTYPWFTSIMFKEPKFDYGLCVFDIDGNDYSETISDYDCAIFFDVTYVQSTHTLTIECDGGNIEDFIDCIKPTYVYEIENHYIGRGVLKTTPQTLSDADKNQALANLGIDPIVWKYICNPFIIYAEQNNTVPDDLRSIIDEGGSLNLNPLILKLIVVKFEGEDAKIYNISAMDAVSVYYYHNDRGLSDIVYSDGEFIWV